MKKIIISIVCVFYFILTIAVTYILLSYNKYNITEFKNSYLLTLKENTKEYNSSELLLIKKNSNVKENDKIFYYNKNNKGTEVKVGQVKKVDEKNQTIVLDDELVLTEENILGTIAQTTAYPVLGTIHNILTSRIGYLIAIILPMLVAFIYEIYAITKEIKNKWRKK